MPSDSAPSHAASYDRIRRHTTPSSSSQSSRLARIDNWRGGVPRSAVPSEERSVRGVSAAASTSSGGSFWTQSRTLSGLSSNAERKERRRRVASLKRQDAEAALIASLPGLTFRYRDLPYRALDKEILIAPPDHRFLEYYLEHPITPAPVDFNDWVFVEANTVVELNHLRKFGRRFKQLEQRHREAVFTAAEHVADLLRLDAPIPFPEIEELKSVKFQRGKFPGIEYARLGFKTRAAAQELALQHAEEAYAKLLAGEAVAPQLNRMGGRGKFVKKEKLEASGDKPTAGRLIFMGGQRDVLLNGLLEQPLTRAYKASKYPISLGKTWWHGGTVEFTDRFADFDKFSCFDAAAFDSSLPEWLIRLALNVLREQYWDGANPKYDQYWEFILEGLAKSDVMLDNGMVFGREGGSTSGHNFNTLMQSVATLIISYTCHLLKVGVERAEEVFASLWVESLGDDQHAGQRGCCAGLSVEDLGPIAEEVFGVDWMGDKSFDTTLLIDDDVGAFQGSQYLGKYFREVDEVVDGVQVTGVLPYRPTSETLLRLAFPERGLLTWSGTWERAIGHYADSAGNPVTRRWMEGYLDWLQDHGAAGEFEWDGEWSRKFTHGDPEGDVQIPTKRISYIEWLRLVLI